MHRQPYISVVALHQMQHIRKYQCFAYTNCIYLSFGNEWWNLRLCHLWDAVRDMIFKRMKLFTFIKTVLLKAWYNSGLLRLEIWLLTILDIVCSHTPFEPIFRTVLSGNFSASSIYFQHYCSVNLLLGAVRMKEVSEVLQGNLDQLIKNLFNKDVQNWFTIQQILQ